MLIRTLDMLPLFHSKRISRTFRLLIDVADDEEEIEYFPIFVEIDWKELPHERQETLTIFLRVVVTLDVFRRTQHIKCMLVTGTFSAL